jgi:hypothetical protein
VINIDRQAGKDVFTSGARPVLPDPRADLKTTKYRNVEETLWWDRMARICDQGVDRSDERFAASLALAVTAFMDGESHGPI